MDTMETRRISIFYLPLKTGTLGLSVCYVVLCYVWLCNAFLKLLYNKCYFQLILFYKLLAYCGSDES